MEKNNMNTFTEITIKGLKEQLGADCTIKVAEVKKNNGLIKTGISIPNDHRRVNPVIYLDGFAKEYEEGRCLNDIIDEIIELSRNHAVQDSDLPDFMDYDKIKDMIMVKLINKKNNTQLLSDVPYFDFLDLAAVCYIKFGECEDGIMTTMIHDNYLKAWEVEEKELFHTALANTKALEPVVITDMSQILNAMAAETGIDMNQTDFEEYNHSGLYVLSNKSAVNGATSLLFSENLEKFADQVNADVLVLPSSIHETLLLKMDSSRDLMEIKDMVKDINEHQVSPEERLSNNIYIYSRKDRKITVYGEEVYS